MTKTIAFVLPESHIDWIKEKAEDAGGISASAALRKVISDAIKRESSTAPVVLTDNVKDPECEVGK